MFVGVQYQKDGFAMEDLDFNNRLVFTSKEANSSYKPKQDQILVCKCYRFAHRKKQMSGGCGGQNAPGAPAEPSPPEAPNLDEQEPEPALEPAPPKTLDAGPTLASVLTKCGLGDHLGVFEEHFQHFAGLMKVWLKTRDYCEKFLMSHGWPLYKTSQLVTALDEQQ